MLKAIIKETPLTEYLNDLLVMGIEVTRSVKG